MHMSVYSNYLYIVVILYADNFLYFLDILSMFSGIKIYCRLLLRTKN